MFRKDIQKHGIKYAAACRLMLLDEKTSIKIIKKLAQKCSDYAYSLDYPQNKEIDWGKEIIQVTTPCGLHWSDCRECGVSAMCTLLEER